METDDNLLPLITELNAALEAALGSLGGMLTDGEATYLVWMASHVFRLVEGYIKLRNAGSTYASKLMVRPIIESVTVAVAAAKKPEFFIFQARKEHREAKRLLGEVCAIYKAHGQSTKEIEGYIAAMEMHWHQFEGDWVKRHPKAANRPKKMAFKEVLDLIGLGNVYAQYCIYSHFTHGSVRAAAGDFDAMTNEPDNLIVGYFVLAMLYALKKHTPATLPDLGDMPKRLTSFMKNNCQ